VKDRILFILQTSQGENKTPSEEQLKFLQKRALKINWTPTYRSELAKLKQKSLKRRVSAMVSSRPKIFDLQEK
jgi:hypothetical protein